MLHYIYLQILVIPIIMSNFDVSCQSEYQFIELRGVATKLRIKDIVFCLKIYEMFLCQNVIDLTVLY